MGETLTGTRSSLTATIAPRANLRAGALVPLFTATLFVSAFLMFLVEPMIARILLPVLGGAPAVWNTCLVFFQVMLLAGYGYAHGATKYLGTRRHVVVHCLLLLLPLAVLPIAVRHVPPTGATANPTLWLLGTLFASIGLPFFVLSTSAAVLQKWFSATDDGAAADPYFLYAASNLGSFIALMAYPLAVEPALRLQQQAALWTAGYVMLVLLTMTCGLIVWRRPPAAAATGVDAVVSSGTIARGRRLRWTALSAVPSSLLLAVTNYISTDVASVPLLWVLPLGLYLLTFVIAFGASTGRLRDIASRLMPVSVILLALMLIAEMASPLAIVIPIHLGVFLVIAITCHGELASDRPAPQHLTEFYFWIALGGMIGGLFNALIAPVIFDSILEYPLVLVAACLLRAGSWPLRRPAIADVAVPLGIGAAVGASILVNNQFGSLSRYILLGAAIPAVITLRQKHFPVRFASCISLILLAGALTRSPFGDVVYAKRTFFGVNRVRVDEGRGYRFIFHGTTLHGMQHLDPARSQEPVSYFHRSGPVGQMFASVPAASATPRVAVLGLGVGTLASYRTARQQWTFYEIDPVVEQIARNDAYFTYLRTCGDACAVITGDGRLSLAAAGANAYGVIMLDAFSSDAVPMHLLTKEALALYVSKLAPGGVIAFNISNWHLSFEDVLSRLTADAGLAALWQREPPDAGSWAAGKFPSEWFLVAREAGDFGSLNLDPRWKVPHPAADTPLWTDDFSNILSVIRR